MATWLNNLYEKHIKQIKSLTNRIMNSSLATESYAVSCPKCGGQLTVKFVKDKINSLIVDNCTGGCGWSFSDYDKCAPVDLLMRYKDHTRTVFIGGL